MRGTRGGNVDLIWDEESSGVRDFSRILFPFLPKLTSSCLVLTHFPNSQNYDVISDHLEHGSVALSSHASGGLGMRLVVAWE